MVRKYRHAVMTAFLSQDEVERVLTATDRSTLSGRRDRAILLLLARLGLRAGEIVSLELNDIQWRAAEIVVRGKGRMADNCRWCRTSAKLWCCTFVKTVALVHRGGSSYVYGRLVLV